SRPTHGRTAPARFPASARAAPGETPVPHWPHRRAGRAKRCSSLRNNPRWLVGARVCRRTAASIPVNLSAMTGALACNEFYQAITNDGGITIANCASDFLAGKLEIVGP